MAALSSTRIISPPSGKCLLINEDSKALSELINTMLNAISGKSNDCKHDMWNILYGCKYRTDKCELTHLGIPCCVPPTSTSTATIIEENRINNFLKKIFSDFWLFYRIIEILYWVKDFGIDVDEAQNLLNNVRAQIRPIANTDYKRELDNFNYPYDKFSPYLLDLIGNLSSSLSKSMQNEDLVSIESDMNPGIINLINKELLKAIDFIIKLKSISEAYESELKRLEEEKKRPKLPSLPTVAKLPSLPTVSELPPTITELPPLPTPPPFPRTKRAKTLERTPTTTTTTIFTPTPTTTSTTIFTPTPTTTSTTIFTPTPTPTPTTIFTPTPTAKPTVTPTAIKPEVVSGERKIEIKLAPEECSLESSDIQSYLRKLYTDQINLNNNDCVRRPGHNLWSPILGCGSSEKFKERKCFITENGIRCCRPVLGPKETKESKGQVPYDIVTADQDPTLFQISNLLQLYDNLLSLIYLYTTRRLFSEDKRELRATIELQLHQLEFSKIISSSIPGIVEAESKRYANIMDPSYIDKLIEFAERKLDFAQGLLYFLDKATNPSFGSIDKENLITIIALLQQLLELYKSKPRVITERKIGMGATTLKRAREPGEIAGGERTISKPRTRAPIAPPPKRPPVAIPLPELIRTINAMCERKELKLPTTISECERKIIELCRREGKESIEFKRHQLLVLNYMINNRALIAVHSPGSGKTLMSALVIFCLLSDPRQDIRDVIILSKPVVQKHWVRELNRIGLPEGYRIVAQDYIDSALKEPRGSDEKRIYIMTAQKLHEDFKTCVEVKESEGQCRLSCKNVLLIIDEAQMFKTEISESGNKGAWANTLTKCAKAAKKALLLTGTPIPNDSYDIVNLISMVDPRTKPPLKKAEFYSLLNNAERLLNYLKCKISYYKTSWRDVPPEQRIGYPKVVEHEEILKMSDDYQRKYELIEDKQLNKELKKVAAFKNPFTFYVGLRIASDGIEVKGELNPKIKRVWEIVSERREEKKSPSVQYQYPKTMIYSNFINSGIGPVADFLDEEANIYLDKRHRIPPIQYIEKTRTAKKKDKETGEVKRVKVKKIERQTRGINEVKERWYTEISGDISEEERDLAVQRFNAIPGKELVLYEKASGDSKAKPIDYVRNLQTTRPDFDRHYIIYPPVQFILLGPAGREGVDLKNTRLEFIMDPGWNQSNTDQGINRGVRYKGHEGLPPEEREVDIYYLYLDKKNKEGKVERNKVGLKKEGVELILRDLIKEKQKALDVFEEYLKAASIEENDCINRA